MSLSLFSGRKQQARRSQVVARAACVETLETRTLLSTFYVATTGSDGGAGSITAPFKTIQYALNQASSGDTVTLRGGTYNLSSEIRIAKPNITLQGYQGETAKIVAPINNSSIEVAVRVDVDADYAKLINLDISGGYYYSLKTESLVDSGAPSEYGPQHLLISNSKLHDSGRDVIKLTPKTDYSIIEFSEIYNSGRRDPSNAEGIDAVQANYSILRDSYIHDTTTNGVYYKGGDIGTVIERNRVTNTAHSGILLGQMTDENWFDEAKNPNLYESIDAVVRNNIVWNTEGAGIGAWAALRPQIYNNTMYNVAKSMFGGLLVQGQEHWFPSGSDWVGRIVPSTDVTMYNNIVVVSGTRPALEVRSEGLTGFLKSDYNYFYKTNGSASFSNDVKGVYGNFTAWKAAGYDLHSFEGNPGLDTANLYHLTSSSAAINKGMTLSLVTSDYDKQARPASGAFDIGADEFGGTVTTPTDPTPTEPTPTEPSPTDPAPVITPTWTNTGFTSQTGTFNLEFDATPVQGGIDMVMGSSSGAVSSVTGMAAIVRFNTSGTIDARKGGAYAADMNFAYQAGKKYHVKLVVNVAARTYDVYVTAPGAATATKIATGYAFRTEQANVQSLNNLATFNEIGDAAIAGMNVSAVTTTEPAPTPSTPGYVNIPVAAQTGKFTLQVAASAAQRNKSVMFGISNGAADSVADMTVAVRFNSAGVIDVRTGGSWRRATALKYQAGVTYHFRIEVDMTTRKFDVFVINPTAGTTTKITAGYSLNNGATSVNNFVRMNANGGIITTGTPVLSSTSTLSVTPAPSTTTDLALGKTATASSTEGTDYVASMVNDGQDSTRWASGTIGGTSWVAVDLGATYDLTTVKLNWEYASAAAYQIQVSSDGVNWSTASSQTNAPHDGWTTTSISATGRFVRVLCTAPTSEWGYSIFTMQVFGK